MATIISIVWYKVLPPLFGGQKGIALFNQCLSRSHPVTCLCSSDNSIPAGLSYSVLPQLPPGKWQFLNPVCQRKIVSFIKKGKPDYILLEHPYHGIAASSAKKKTGARLILHAHNIESERFRQIGKWWWRILYHYEKWVCRQADMILFKTARDRDFAISRFGIAPSKCMIIPYGIDPPRLPEREKARKQVEDRHGIGPDEAIFLFAGTLDYPPNATAVGHIYKEIVPRLAAAGLRYKIILCGRNKHPRFKHLSRLSHPAVITAGETADITLYFAAADLFINPVQTGGGMQTKIMDALAHHCTTVCFQSMAEGIDSTLAGDKLLLAGNGDWDNFVQRIQMATGIRQKTPAAFLDRFNWDTIIQPFLKQLASGEPSAFSK